jgi:hypothetical protein
MHESKAQLLLPLNRPRRLRRNVVDNAVDAADLVDDARRGTGQQLVREPAPVRGHVVRRRDGAQCQRLLVRPRIAHDADGLARQQHSKCLTRMGVLARRLELADEDVVGLPARRGQATRRGVSTKQDGGRRTRWRSAFTELRPHEPAPRTSASRSPPA